MATVLTNNGEDWVAQRIAGTGSLSSNAGSHIAHGTGGAAAAKGDTALGTEVDTRAVSTVSVTGSGSTAKYQAVGTVTAGATRAIIEAGLFNQLAVGGTMFMRSDFATINLASGDSVQYTFTLDPA